MAEEDRSTVDADEAGIKGGAQDGLRILTGRRLEQAQGRRGAERSCQQQLARRRRKTDEAGADELAQGRRHGQVPTGPNSGAIGRDRTGQLQRVERVAAGQLPDARQRRPAEAGADGRAQQLMECAHRQGFEPHAFDPDGPRGRAEPERKGACGLVAPLRHQHADRQVGQTAEREREGLATRMVRPGPIVNRDEQRPLPDHGPASGQDGHGHPLGVGGRSSTVVVGICRVAHAERTLECLAVSGREPRRDRVRARGP